MRGKCRGHTVFLSGVAIVRQDDIHDEIYFILHSLLVGSCMNREGGFYVNSYHTLVLLAGVAKMTMCFFCFSTNFLTHANVP